MEFSLSDAVLTINGNRITGFENAQDAISIAPIGDDGDITYGTSGDGVFVHACNQGATITIKILQHAAANKLLMDLRNEQVNNSKTSAPSTISYKDLRNGDEFLLTKCWFTTSPTHARGTSHNGYTWTLKATKAEFKLTEGK
ncbi:uncharacterized protein DUF3277 [Orbus hercynius]|uniref:Uncharacterized protein DUF3277 n=1 Tax=Orbus hercynius TaxID=593135 RepID=A0A495RHE4_9GAMM|nr:phage protein [Orbus hercynius]RKS86912.1 uncharacterized protein DUF3277 [Orbus hercynius]